MQAWTQLPLSLRFPGERERVAEEEYKNAEVSTYELRVQVWWRAAGVAGVCHLKTAKMGEADAILEDRCSESPF